MSSSNENEFAYNQAVRIGALICKARENQPMSPAEQQELNLWLHCNESNKQLLESLDNRDQLAAELEALLLYDEDSAVENIFATLGVPRKRKVIPMNRWLAAASVLLVIGIASWWFIRKGDPTNTITYKTINTAPGEQHRVLLADGTEVWLSAASSIKYPTSFTGNTREVTITGEAYFEVTKDKTKPFIVTTNRMKVQVLGTKFDVMAYGDEDVSRVTLIEGSVKVNSVPARPGANRQSAILKPGEQAEILADSRFTIHEKSTINADEVNAWRIGQFNFNETDMPSIMRQLARWYPITIEYRGNVDNIHFSGQISRKENINELLDILSDTRKVHFEKKNDSTIVVIPGHK